MSSKKKAAPALAPQDAARVLYLARVLYEHHYRTRDMAANWRGASLFYKGMWCDVAERALRAMQDYESRAAAAQSAQSDLGAELASSS